MSAIGPMHTGMCMYLHPRGFRGDRPGWFLCTLTGKEVPKHRLSNCVRGGCQDYRERDDEVVAQAKLNWDGPADQTVSTAPHSLTLREWAQSRVDGGEALAAIANRIGCSWSTLNNAVKQPKKQDAKPVQKTRKEPSGSCAEETQPVPTQELGTCWNCRQQFPADSMHPDGDTLECEDCYRKAHEPASEPTPTPAPPADRCQRCECEVDGRLIMSGVGTVCEPCAEAIRQEWEAAERSSAPTPEPETEPTSIAQPRYYDPTETRRAAQAYLRHIGLGDKECFALCIWLDAWAARGEAA